MAKFPFMVKHNGVLYTAGKEVPVGKEANKTTENEDMSASEIREKLKELGIKKFPSNKKADLLLQLEEAQKEAEDAEKEDEETSEETSEENTAEENNEEENSEEDSEILEDAVNEANSEDNKEASSEDSDLLTTIITE